MIVSQDLTGAEWRTSSRSGGSGQCVEVATNLSGIVAVRHSKRPDAEVIIYTEAEWAAFIGGAKDGEFDQ
ncbi:DUF397 domain-containing protein [Actinoplanes sp. NBRC 103695]|uniref:DUF397 domain-containing protein n=1 Tax=Actinoplanes sp. NBRC 103695 TaxID=3032202 RepID=UPI0024A3AA74|nr:DUF397 domain-containing protein [Actinoplanes sp. NBRC 103695]GLY95736.1 transcriptional regulator [Actinoplanes sp. NBRC 103695]